MSCLKMVNNMQKVIDVSEHNGAIDWRKVKKAGYHAIIRCGYGRNLVKQDDKRFAYNVKECERLGIPYGVYLYSYAKDKDSALSEAAHALRLVQDNCGDFLLYPIYFDSEQPGTQKAARSNAIAFGDIIEKAGYWCGLYASESWYRNYLQGTARFTSWVAKWGSVKPSKCDMWQMSDKGIVPGIKGAVDTNICYRNFPCIISKDYSTALDVLAGEYGNGSERKSKLGKRYSKIQSIVNRILA